MSEQGAVERLVERWEAYCRLWATTRDNAGDAEQFMFEAVDALSSLSADKAALRQEKYEQGQKLHDLAEGFLQRAERAESQLAEARRLVADIAEAVANCCGCLDYKDDLLARIAALPAAQGEE